MKAINPHASLEEPIKEKVEEDGVNPKRKEAIGEDCPVYVILPVLACYPCSSSCSKSEDGHSAMLT